MPLYNKINEKKEVVLKSRRDFVFQVIHFGLLSSSLDHSLYNVHAVQLLHNQEHQELLLYNPRPLRISHDVLHPWAVNPTAEAKDTYPQEFSVVVVLLLHCLCCCNCRISFREGEIDPDHGDKRGTMMKFLNALHPCSSTCLIL